MHKHRRPRDRVSKDIHHNKPDHPNPTPTGGTAPSNHPPTDPTDPSNPADPTKSGIVTVAHQSSNHPNPAEADNTPDDLDIADDLDTAEIPIGTSPENFDPVKALQYLHLEVVQLEALANAANEAVIHLPFPSGREERRVFNRVYALVTKVADETSALVRQGDRMIAALQTYLQRRSVRP